MHNFLIKQSIQSGAKCLPVFPGQRQGAAVSRGPVSKNSIWKIGILQDGKIFICKKRKKGFDLRFELKIEDWILRKY